MTSVNIYLIFNGNCGEAFRFYKKAFGGDFEMISKFGEMPPQEGQVLSEEDKEKIMHVKLPISAETVLYGSDSLTPEQKVTFGNNFSVSINVDAKEKADDLFAKLSEEGKITMPLQTTFWGAYFGMWTDKFGVNWMVNYDED
jgi:PhnB protein